IPLAETYLRQQKYDLLLREIPEGTRPDAIEAEVRLNRGLAQIYMKRLPEAEETLNDALRRAPESAHGLTAMARLKAIQNGFAEAKAFTARAIATDPKYVEAWVLQAQLNRSLKDSDGARSDLDKALEIEPGNVVARLVRAQLLIDQGQVGLA